MGSNGGLAVADGDARAAQRSLLLSLRTRFAPETQSLKHAAIEKIAEQVLCAAVHGGRLSLPDIEKKIDRILGEGTSAVHRSDVREALKRLTTAERVIGEGSGLEERLYRLTDQTRDELTGLEREAQRKSNRVVQLLFEYAPGGQGKYYAPFFECLRLVFARIADAYVRQIRGDGSPSETAAHEAVTDALRDVAAASPSLDADTLKAGVLDFLTQSNPEFDSIKWNLTQNSYLLRVLGLDDKGFLLSKEVLGQAILYLDTNVLIPALEARAHLHRSFVALSRACAQLDMSLRVTTTTLEEFRGVVVYQKDLIAKVQDEIPDKTGPKVRSLFFQALREARVENPGLSVDEFFASFEDPQSILDSLGVEVVDDPWFEEASGTIEIRKLATVVQKEYKALHPDQVKRDRAATHDALMIMWVERQRSEADGKVWLATLDTSLPAFMPDKGAADRRPLAITLDALLQWVSPIVSRQGADEDLSEIFSEALRQQILPNENFFDLNDFLIFAELECSCRELPAGDVEKCIQYLGTKAHVDLSDPVNREKMHHEIAKFFVDPARKHKQEVERLEREVSDKDIEIRDLLVQHETSLQQLSARSQTEIGQLRDEVLEKDQEKDRVVAELGLQVETLKKGLSDERDRSEAERLKRSARSRIAWVVALLCILELAGLGLALHFGSGSNTVQRALSFWWVYGLIFGACIVLAWSVLGRERLNTLPEPFRRVFRSE